jgi:O-antigen ligase
MEYNLGLFERLALAIGWTLLAIGYTVRGLQYGFVLVLVSMMMRLTLFADVRGLPDITLDRLVWPVVVLMFFVKWRRGETERLPLDWIECALLSLVIVVVMSIRVSDNYPLHMDSSGVRFRPFLNGFLYPLVAYFIVRRAIRSTSQVQGFLVGIGMITIYLIVTGLGEALHQDWLVFPKYILNPDIGIHYGHVRGPFINAGTNGMAITMVLPTLLWLFLAKRDTRSWIWLGAFILASVAVGYSLQRAVWLGTAIVLGAMVVAWPKRGMVLLGGLTLATLLGLAVISGTPLAERLTKRLGDENSIEFRYEMKERSLAVIRENVWTGVGFNRFTEATSEFARGGNISHNTLLTIFAELGLLGLLPYLSIFFALFVAVCKGYLQQPGNRSLVIIFVGIALAYLVKLNTSNIINAGYLNILFFILAGIVKERIRMVSPVRRVRVKIGRPEPRFVRKPEFRGI